MISEKNILNQAEKGQRNSTGKKQQKAHWIFIGAYIEGNKRESGRDEKELENSG
jgi:hypothetical protein